MFSFFDYSRRVRRGVAARPGSSGLSPRRAAVDSGRARMVEMDEAQGDPSFGRREHGERGPGRGCRSRAGAGRSPALNTTHWDWGMLVVSRG